ncbi:MAG: hypothetical protein CVT49_08135 [candidate division Zixibacteria bacterium HGW-Zixibacteria-1]|nr:MAG: hypothetical protein CVT49_08135 [candidate division Zixibacteria bacterium HGW-Zixibacteria-1]
MSNDVFKDKALLLKSAIKSEIDGFTFYDLLSKQAANTEAKRRLENLRNDEARHRATLIDIYKKEVGGEIGALPDTGISPLQKAFVGGKLKKFNSEVEYINLAIEAELDAVEFYKKGSAIISDAGFKNIMKEMAEEESGHYEILMAEREALSGNYFWFSSDGTSPMED